MKEIKCAVKSYNPYTAQSVCLDCPVGYYCDQEGMKENINTCPVGNFCPLNSEIPTKCNAGTFNPLQNGVSTADCKTCLPGYYCPTQGLANPIGLCSDGYYCRSGSINTAPGTAENPTPAVSKYGPCPGGSYCPSGTIEPIPCPPGTFSSVELKFLISHCTACTAGKYCSESGRTAVEGDCAEGYYCEVSSKEPKPPSKFCVAGEYCPIGSPTATKCVAGTYQNNPRQKECKACPPGYFCPLGSTDYTSNPCPTGSYCPLNTTNAIQYKCAAGTYNPNTKGSTIGDCIACPPGKYCSAAGGSTTSGDCNGGYYCTIGAKTASPSQGADA